MKPKRTQRQREIMGHILKAAGEGRFLTQKELYEILDMDATYGALRVSVRWLETQEMLERQKSAGTVYLVPTERGFDWFRPKIG